MSDRRLITDRMLKSLRPAPKGRRVEHWDARVSGFGIRVHDIEDAYPARRGKAGKVTFLEARPHPEDWGLVPLTSQQGRDSLDIIDDRHGRRSTIVTSQIPDGRLLSGMAGTLSAISWITVRIHWNTQF